MKNMLIFLTASVVLLGCQKDESNAITTPAEIKQSYYHLTLGDSLRYNPDYVMWIDSLISIKSKKYFVVRNFPSDEFTRRHFLRKDSDENVYIINSYDTTSTEYLLIKSDAKENESWNFKGTSVATMVSRTDTVITEAGIFTKCMQIKIQWWSLEYEILWFAPNIGLVKREFDTASARPILVGNLALKSYKLK